MIPSYMILEVFQRDISDFSTNQGEKKRNTSPTLRFSLIYFIDNRNRQGKTDFEVEFYYILTTHISCEQKKKIPDLPHLNQGSGLLIFL